MRNRRNFIGLWLSDKEYTHLKSQCEISGLSASAHIRKIIIGEQLRPRPPDTYAKLLRELSAIGNNINQIATRANMDIYQQENFEGIRKELEILNDNLCKIARRK